MNEPPSPDRAIEEVGRQIERAVVESPGPVRPWRWMVTRLVRDRSGAPYQIDVRASIRESAVAPPFSRAVYRDGRLAGRILYAPLFAPGPIDMPAPDGPPRCDVCRRSVEGVGMPLERRVEEIHGSWRNDVRPRFLVCEACFEVRAIQDRETIRKARPEMEVEITPCCKSVEALRLDYGGKVIVAACSVCGDARRAASLERPAGIDVFGDKPIQTMEAWTAAEKARAEAEQAHATALSAAAQRLRARAAVLTYEGQEETARILREEADRLER